MSNKHTANDLAVLQALPLELKIRKTKQRIREWYEYWNGEVYVSFSGGKDSTVLKHIVDSMYSDVPSVFINTGLEYPEVQKFAMSQPNVITIRPAMRFDEVIKKYGYPVISKEVAQVVEEARRHATTGKYTYRVQRLNGTLLDKNGNLSAYNCPQYKYLLEAPFNISNKCCDVMKKKPAKQYEKNTGKKAFIGTMTSESRARHTAWLINGCNAFEKNRPTSQPLSFWTEQDILTYLLRYNVQYCSVYGDIVPADPQITFNELDGNTPKLKLTGVTRTGCMFCMFGVHLEKHPNRFQLMKETHPKQYEYCMKSVEDGGLGLAEVLDFIGVDY